MSDDTLVASDAEYPGYAAVPACLNVSIVAYHNSPQQLGYLRDTLLCAESVRCITLIDNARDERLASLFSGHRSAYFAMPDNQGYGRAHNVALRQSLADGVAYHLVLNPDISLDAAALDACVARMLPDPELALLMPKVLYPDGQLQRQCRQLPHPGVLLARRFLPHRVRQSMDSRYRLADYDYQDELDAPALSGCFMLLRTAFLRQAGLFDERYFMYMEDYDLTRRLARYGRTICWPGATIIHEYRRESARSARLFWVHAWSAIQYFCKWGWLRDQERKDRNTHAARQLREHTTRTSQGS